jgi:hypothetical protein
LPELEIVPVLMRLFRVAKLEPCLAINIPLPAFPLDVNVPEFCNVPARDPASILTAEPLEPVAVITFPFENVVHPLPVISMIGFVADVIFPDVEVVDGQVISAA